MQADNRAPSPRGILLTLLRTAFGAFLFSLFYYALGWLLASHDLGWVLAGWSLFVGPLVVGPLLWLIMRYTQKLVTPVPFSRDATLAHEYLRGILHQPGPQPRVWKLATRSLVFFWIENPFGKSHQQEIIISEAWLKQSPELKVADWRAIWGRIVAMPRTQRRVRSLQMLFWFAALAPLEIVVKVLDMALRAVGVYLVEDIGFLLQKAMWSLKTSWFGENKDEGVIWAPLFSSKKQKLHRPGILSSLIWGPWVYLPQRQIHPLWRVLTHSNIVLEPEA